MQRIELCAGHRFPPFPSAIGTFAYGTQMTLPSAVLFDFTGTLFNIESAQAAVVGALGPDFESFAPALERWGAINGSSTPETVPDELADVWARRDLSAAAHRAAYSGLAGHAGLSAPQAALLYERGMVPAAWQPYPDTVEVLQRLRARGVLTALLSNIGWDPRPVLRTYEVDGLLDVLVLSDERGVQKPDPAIFAIACRELDVDPVDTLMVGDTPETDGAAIEIGCQFALVPRSSERPPDTLLRAVGLID
jgi:HAD superfamily hydrolase (TIGR01509 family)